MAEESTPVKAKSLIANFEKGKLTTNDSGPLSPEMIESELAPKGTAKSLLSMFEKSVQPEPAPVLIRKKKTPPASTETNGEAEPPKSEETEPEVPDTQATEEVKIEVKETEKVEVQETKEADVKSEEPKAEVAIETQTTEVVTKVTTEEVVTEVKVEENAQAEDIKTEEKEEVVVVENEVTKETVEQVAQEKSEAESVLEKAPEEPAAEAPAKAVEAVVENNFESSPTRKNVLIVYANDDDKSLVQALVHAAKSHFTETGCDVALTDLIGENFNPVVSAKDIGGCNSVGEAFEKGELAADILAEQSKLSAADLLLLVFPQYLHGIPAVIKGWLDRVLTVKFAYDLGDKPEMFDEGKLKGKKVLVCQSVAGPASAYTDQGIIGDFNVYMFPLEWGVLRFTGFDVLSSQTIFGTFEDTETRRQSWLNEWHGRLEGVWKESPRQFLSLDLFDSSKGYILTDAAKLDLQTRSSAVNVGQHLGKPVTSFGIGQ